MDYIELLNAISYSRLLWATKEQLVNHIGDKRLKEHSMKEEFDTVFMQRAVYKSLADEIENKSNGRINLAAIIENYKTASAFFNEKMGIRYFTNSKDKKQHIFDMLLYVYGNHHIPDEVKGKLREVLSGIYDNDNKIQKVNAAILFLLLIHSLPTYNSKHDATNIEKDFRNAIGYLKEWEMSDCAPIYKYEAFIGEASKQDKRNIANFKRIPLLNRAMLIAMVQEIFDYIDVMLHIDISKKYIELRQKTLYFPKIDGLWCRDKTCKTPPFYYIKRLSNVYLVFKCELQNGELVRKRQELYLYSQAELLPDMLMPINTEDSKRKNVQYCHANIIPNDYIKAGCELNNKEDATIDDKTQNYFCELHQKNNVPQKIVLKLIDQYGVHNDKTEWFYIPENENSKDLYKKCISCRETGFKYVFRLTIAAITTDYIYIGIPYEIPYDEDVWVKDYVNTYQGYYKIPKNRRELAVISNLYDLFGILISEEDGVRRIFVGGKTGYYEVTTEEDRERFGIELLETLPL